MKCESIREYKEMEKLKNHELAKMFGVSTLYISLLLNGHRRPSLELADKINAITGIPVLDLLRFEVKK